MEKPASIFLTHPCRQRGCADWDWENDRPCGWCLWKEPRGISLENEDRHHKTPSDQHAKNAQEPDEVKEVSWVHQESP
jgi:hypothetical protein